MKGDLPVFSDEDYGEDRQPVSREVTTACGGTMLLEENTPCVIFQGKKVFFCLPACQQDFERDPYTSCLEGRL